VACVVHCLTELSRAPRRSPCFRTIVITSIKISKRTYTFINSPPPPRRERRRPGACARYTSGARSAFGFERSTEPRAVGHSTGDTTTRCHAVMLTPRHAGDWLAFPTLLSNRSLSRGCMHVHSCPQDRAHVPHPSGEGSNLAAWHAARCAHVAHTQAATASASVSSSSGSGSTHLPFSLMSSISASHASSFGIARFTTSLPT